MFTKIKTFFILLGYKIKELPLWEKLKEIPRKTWIILGSCVAGVVAISVAVALLLPLFVGGGVGGIFGVGGSVGGDNSSDVTGEHAAEDIRDVYVNTPPSKTRYSVGDSANYKGLVIGVMYYNDNVDLIFYDEQPELFTITGFDSNNPNEQLTISVTYQGHTCAFPVIIDKRPDPIPLLVSTELEPPKTEYKLYEPFSLAGGYLVCSYDNGDKLKIPLLLDHVSGFEQLENGVGEYVINVVYREGPITYEGSYTITVTE